jgi:protein-tyrosine phosphatase
MAAALLNKWSHRQNQISVSSAGLNAKPEKPADPRAVAAAAQFGVSLKEHHARALTAEMVVGSDVIFVMDFENEAVLLSRFPQAREKTFLLGGFATGPANKSVEIPDPYDGDLAEVSACYEQMEPHVREVARRLSQKK